MKFYIIVFLFFSLFTHSQIDKGNIVYSLKIDTLENISKTKYLKNNLKRAIDAAKYLKFNLKFNNKLALFTMTDAMSSENNDMNLARIFSNYRGKIYQDKSSNYYEVDNEFGQYVIKREPITNWKITKEFKLIDKFKCYKATCDYIVKNKMGTFIHPVIAWFCPAIPFSYGPNGYGNLPGLILELQERNVVYGASKIDLNTNENLISNINLKFKIITEEEYTKIVERVIKELD